ncbi:uncharacterized protein PG998_006196 [Apiospora kogelbergensis]|uniref:uncharacterized protein n=1 Tax=Apiospora kogelbergensis TaxID=1337665 RepID=UPI0031301CF9
MDPGPIHRRRRPAIACTECRRRKVSCDLASPCGPCQKSRTYLRCVYNNNNNNSNNNAGDRKKRGSNLSTESLNNINNSNIRKAHTRGRRSTSEFSSRSGSGDIAESVSSASVATYTSFPQSNQPHPSVPKIPDLDNDLLYMDSAALDITLFSGVDFLGVDQLGYREPPSHPKPELPLPEGIWDTSKNLEFPSIFPCNQFSLDLEHNWNTQPAPTLHLAGQANVSRPPDARWLGLDVGCDVVRLLLRKCTRAASEGEEFGQSQDGIARPLVEILDKLEQTALQEHENEAATTFNMWPGASSLDLTASAAKRLLPSRVQCDILVKTYINTFEAVLSIVHVPSFLQEYERLWEVGTVAEETFICNLLLIVTLGSYAAPRPLASYEDQSTIRSQATYWVTFVKHWTTQQMVSGYRASIGTAQTMCLMALTKLVLPQHNTGTGTSLLLGDHDLTRIGIQIGLHRKPTANMSRTDAEIHRGLWATMLELSLQHCLDKGHPAPLTPASYDCEPPSGSIEGNDDCNRADGDGNDESFCPASTGGGKHTIVEMLTATQKLRIQVLDVLNAPSSPQAYESSHRLAAEINEICNANMATLQRRPSSATRDFQVHMLDMFTRPFVIALHCPFADQASATNPTYYYSRIMRMELSALLLAHPCSSESFQHDDNSNNVFGSATSLIGVVLLLAVRP